MFFPASRHYHLHDYCVLDLETTGLKASKCDIIECAILKIRNDKPVQKMEVLIQPSSLPLPPFITRLTGITSEMLIEAPRLEEVEYWIWDFIGDDPILGYNVLFDLGFLREHTRKQTAGNNVFLDVLPLARICYPELASHSLSNMTSHLGLYQNTHRAMDDVIATWQLYQLCMEQLEDKTDAQIELQIEQNKAERKARRKKKNPPTT